MIRLEEINKSFSGQVLFENLNLHVRKRETVVLFGPSGMGKTILIKLCLGLILPDHGKVFIDGDRVDSMNEDELINMRLKTGTLFQYYALFDSMTVAENVGFYLKNHTELSEKEIADRVHHELKTVHLEGNENVMPSELSGGMKKRVGIARALIHRPKIIFYDSPTDGLDPVTADTVIDLIQDLNENLGITSLIISNDMNISFRIASKMGMLHKGHLRIYGAPNEISSSKDPYVYQFIRGLDKGPLVKEYEQN